MWEPTNPLALDNATALPLLHNLIGPNDLPTHCATAPGPTRHHHQLLLTHYHGSA